MSYVINSQPQPEAWKAIVVVKQCVCGMIEELILGSMKRNKWRRRPNVSYI